MCSILVWSLNNEKQEQNWLCISAANVDWVVLMAKQLWGRTGNPHTKSQNPSLVYLVIVHLPYIFRIFIFFREKGHLVKLVKIMPVETLCVSVRFSQPVCNCFLFFSLEVLLLAVRISQWVCGSAVGSFVLVLFANPFHSSIGTHIAWVRSPEQLWFNLFSMKAKEFRHFIDCHLQKIKIHQWEGLTSIQSLGNIYLMSLLLCNEWNLVVKVSGLTSQHVYYFLWPSCL